MFKKIIKIVWLIISILVILILSTVFLEIMKMKLKPIPKDLMGDWCTGDVYVRDYNKLGYFRLKLPPHLKDHYDEDFYNKIGEKSNILNLVPIDKMIPDKTKIVFDEKSKSSCKGNFYLGVECLRFTTSYENGFRISKKKIIPNQETHYNINFLEGDIYFDINISTYHQSSIWNDLNISSPTDKIFEKMDKLDNLIHQQNSYERKKFSKNFYEAFLTLKPVFITNEEAKKLPRNMTLSECVKNTLKSTINY